MSQDYRTLKRLQSELISSAGLTPGDAWLDACFFQAEFLDKADNNLRAAAVHHPAHWRVFLRHTTDGMLVLLQYPNAETWASFAEKLEDELREAVAHFVRLGRIDITLTFKNPRLSTGGKP